MLDITACLSVRHAFAVSDYLQGSGSSCLSTGKLERAGKSFGSQLSRSFRKVVCMPVGAPLPAACDGVQCRTTEYITWQDIISSNRIITKICAVQYSAMVAIACTHDVNNSVAHVVVAKGIPSKGLEAIII